MSPPIPCACISANISSAAFSTIHLSNPYLRAYALGTSIKHRNLSNMAFSSFVIVTLATSAHGSLTNTPSAA